MWTDKERAIITDIFAKLDPSAGSEALQRCLIVYPWTMRYFTSFGNLYNAEAIKTNAKIAAHGVTVLHGLELGVHDLDHMKTVYAALGKKHSEELKIDPDNFRLICDCLTIVVAAKMGNKFTPEVQAAFQKFLSVVVFSLSSQYH